MWEHCVTTIENDPMNLDRECDWVIKHKLIEGYRAKHDLPLTHPKVAALDLQYHDISRTARPLLQAAGRRPGRAHLHRRRHRRSGRDAAADHPGPAPGRVHPAGQGAQARLHRRLGAPEAQRPGPAHRPVQGPLPVARRAGREAHRLALVAVPTFRTATVTAAAAGAARAAAGRHRPRARPTSSPSSPGRSRSATGWCSTPPPSTSASAPAAGTSCTGTGARHVRGAGTGAHHEAPLHEPADRRRLHRGARRRDRHRPRRACRWWSGSLHSQVPGVAAAIRAAVPGARLTYVMTDGAALPLAISDLVDGHDPKPA